MRDTVFECLRLEPVELPEGGPLRRDPMLPPDRQLPDFDEKYDYKTVLYGAIFKPDRKAVVLVCPKLLNLEAVLRAGRFTTAVGSLRLRRIRRQRRYDEVWLDCAAPPGRLRFEGPELSFDCAVENHGGIFDGLAVLTTTSQNNELDWIEDWVRHHVRHQKIEGVLFHDNRSTAYAPEAILERLRGIEGLRAARVLSVPSRYGPLAKSRPRGVAKFLQAGVMNLARRGPLALARGVMQCDIDEVVFSEPGAPTLIEAAERSWLGYATAPGWWRYAQLAEGQMPRHSDHIWRRDPDHRSKEKWAVVPGGRLGGLQWEVHGIGRNYPFNRLCMQRGVRFYHCSGVSTFWKGNVAHRTERPNLVEDAATRADFERVDFGN